MMKNVFRAISLVLMAAILLANPVVGSFQARAAFEGNYSDTIEVVSDVEATPAAAPG